VAPGATHPFRDPRLWRLSAGSGLLICAQSAVLGFLVLFLHQARGFSPAAAAAVLALVQLLGAALRLAAGVVSDRRGDRLGPLLRLGLALCVALALSTAFVRAPLVVLLPAVVAAGALSLSWNALSFTATAELAGEARAGAALGFQQTALSLATVVAPVGFGVLVDRTTWLAGFAASTAVALAGWWVLRGLQRVVRR
jgi:sugar phosphate permease